MHMANPGTLLDDVRNKTNLITGLLLPVLGKEETAG
jgi:hypothetical protein